MCEYVNYFETQFGNLNELFYDIFQGDVSNHTLIELMYYYDCIDGLDIDLDEYDARFGDRPFEWKLEKIKIIAKDVVTTIKNSPDYKPVNGVVNRNRYLKLR